MNKLGNFEGGVDEPTMSDKSGMSTESRAVWRKWAMWAVVVIVIAAVLWFAYSWWTGAPFAFWSEDKYQAVFLDNNQVYFGKLSGANFDDPVLRDIYYLRLTQPLQPSSPQPDINLVKLGTELHGPEDEMRINRDHILFIEDLRDDGQVAIAIKQFKEFQAQQQQ